MSDFQDADGLISFATLTSDLVTGTPAYQDGRDLLKRIANYFSSLRGNVYDAMSRGAVAPMPGDTRPRSQWDAAVTHYLLSTLMNTGGLGAHAVTLMRYTQTQVLTDFSRGFAATVFGAATVPDAILGEVTTFVTGVATAIRFNWSIRSRDYTVGVFGQCHEAVPDTHGNLRYLPTFKYYHVTLSPTQSELAAPCTPDRPIAFDLGYEDITCALAAPALDKFSAEHRALRNCVDKAQRQDHRDALLNLDVRLPGTESADPQTVGLYGIDLDAYPKSEPGHGRK